MKTLLQKLRESENTGMFLLALAVGLGGGVGAVVFHGLIKGVDRFFFAGGASRPYPGAYGVIALPAIGLVVVSFIVRRWAPEAKGHGVPEVMYAVRKEGGRIRPRVALVKSIASALCIGTGGSVGREGPIVQIGCSIGSTLGQILKLSEERVKLLVACGAAAGIGGTFNAPIAGVMFAMEVILGNFGARSFGLVVISSVVSTALSRSVLGDAPSLHLKEMFQFVSVREFPIYLALGVLAGIVALVYVRVLYGLERLFDRWKWNEYVKSAIGGLAVGGIGYIGIKYLGGRFLLGVGYDGIEQVLSGNLLLGAMAALVGLKILATALTLSAGGSGGVFAPALFIGAMLGGAFGAVVHGMFPDHTAPAGAYAVVGMGAVFAAAAHAPITSILILFEMTGDYKIILPLMFSVVVSHLLASFLSADSIYTIKLRRLGGMAPRKTELSTLDLILVADAMTVDPQTTRPDVPVSELASLFHAGHVRSLPVIDGDGRLVGIVTEYDVETALMEGHVNGFKAEDIMTTELITCTPDQTLHEVVEHFTSRDIGRIPVVDQDDAQKMVGVLRRGEILWAYGEMATEHRDLLHRTGTELPTDHEDAVQIEIEVTTAHKRVSFKKVRDVHMPDQCLIVVLRRAERAIVPRGDTVIEPGDVLTTLTTRQHEQSLRDWIAHLTQE